MANIWFFSDPHFGHAGFLRFKHEDGTPLRPFATVEEMDECYIQNHNALVKTSDKYYCLGDVFFGKGNLPIVARLNGHGRLVGGNHDEGLKKFIPYFEEIYACRVLEAKTPLPLLLTHVPVHPDSVKPGWTNVHGHVHNNVTALHFGPQYFNMCVEMHNYRPLAIEELRQAIRAQREKNQEIIEANAARLGINTKRWTDEELYGETPRPRQGQS